MPIYNCELYVAEAIESILNQTFADFEFLIIDDCSTDNSLKIAQSYTDNRIKITTKDKNTGYTESLNYGIGIAKGKYIARMDGDDISFPERFAKQVSFLDENPNVILCGTLYQIIGNTKVSKHPITHEEIKVTLISACCIAHPTVLIRKIVFDNYKVLYDVTKEPAEDYDLWSRLVFLGEMSNIGEVLLYYRVHSQQTSVVRSEKQGAVSREIRNRMLQKLIPNIEFSFTPLDIDFKLNDPKFKLKELQKTIKKMDCLVKTNREKEVFDVNFFSKLIKEEQNYICKVLSDKFGRYSLNNLFDVMLHFPAFFAIVGIKKTIMFIGRNLFFTTKKQLFNKVAK